MFLQTFLLCFTSVVIFTLSDTPFLNFHPYIACLKYSVKLHLSNYPIFITSVINTIKTKATKVLNLFKYMVG